MEIHHTPYTPTHRYWTGLLLTVRIILYLVATVNVSNNSTISLTAIIFTVCFILGLKGFIGSRVYGKWSVDVLETFFYLNILFFAGILSPTLRVIRKQLPTLQSISRSLYCSSLSSTMSTCSPQYSPKLRKPDLARWLMDCLLNMM